VQVVPHETESVNEKSVLFQSFLKKKTKPNSILVIDEYILSCDASQHDVMA
jgi:hypothetical protein